MYITFVSVSFRVHYLALWIDRSHLISLNGEADLPTDSGKVTVLFSTLLISLIKLGNITT